MVGRGDDVGEAGAIEKMRRQEGKDDRREGIESIEDEKTMKDGEIKIKGDEEKDEDEMMKAKEMMR